MNVSSDHLASVRNSASKSPSFVQLVLSNAAIVRHLISVMVVGMVAFSSAAALGQAVANAKESSASQTPSTLEKVALSPTNPASTETSKTSEPVVGVKKDSTPTSEHPLMPVLRWAERGLPAVEKLEDYSAVLIKRDRVRGKLGGYEQMFLKIRHNPLSIYACFQSPISIKGQEVIYIAGQNQGNMWAHQPHMPITVSIRPDGLVAMNEQRYPLTEIGLVNLVRRLVEVGQQDVNYGECEVKYFSNVKVNDRSCTAIQVTHPVQRDMFRFHLARIFVDDELTLPVRYEAYSWPSEQGGSPELLEEYTYLNIKVNNGFKDIDFSIDNPEYHFPKITKDGKEMKDSKEFKDAKERKDAQEAKAESQ
jgi:hypothetical protein